MAQGGRSEAGAASLAGEAGVGGEGGERNGFGGRSSAGGDAGGAALGGRAMGSGGFFGAGGSLGTGGSLGAGGSLGGAPGVFGKGSGGVSSCAEGEPCKCDELVGTTQCSGQVSSCSCPPAQQCQKPVTKKCFEPCGGEPFGSWVLEEACLSGASSIGQCAKVLNGAPGKNSLRLRILDGGELNVVGREEWNIAAQISLGCVSVRSVNSCKYSSFFSDALLFDVARPIDCVENACGVCDCEGAISSNSGWSFDTWRREGSWLWLGSTSVPYCASSDELWIGGADSNGAPRAAYKFKKQSCQGKPTPCASRSAEQCTAGGACAVGACKPSSGSSARCAQAQGEAECGVLQGCKWDPTGCSGEVSPTCDFTTCDTEPGCGWGAPVEKCGGYPWGCESRDASQCEGYGCGLVACQLNGNEFADCRGLASASDCAKAPGCSLGSGVVCTGQAACAAQTDAVVCAKLGCTPGPACAGVATDCSKLTLEQCHDVPGCRFEW